MKIGVAALCECDHNLKLTSLTDEFRHDSMQVDLYKYIDVCAVTKYLIDAQKIRGYNCHRKPNSPDANLLYYLII